MVHTRYRLYIQYIQYIYILYVFFILYILYIVCFFCYSLSSVFLFVPLSRGVILCLLHLCRVCVFVTLRRVCFFVTLHRVCFMATLRRVGFFVILHRRFFVCCRVWFFSGMFKKPFCTRAQKNSMKFVCRRPRKTVHYLAQILASKA